jgi:hypothetical protein
MKKTLLMGAALALALAGSAYANGPTSSFQLGGSQGTAVTSSGGGSSSTSGSASIGGGVAGGATTGFSTTEGGAEAQGGIDGVQVQDYRDSTSGGTNFSGSLGNAGSLNVSQAGAGGHEGAAGSFNTIGGTISGFPGL